MENPILSLLSDAVAEGDRPHMALAARDTLISPRAFGGAFTGGSPALPAQLRVAFTAAMVMLQLQGD